MAAKKLSVQMFGGFSAKYGDEILVFGSQGDSKYGQLFQILMTQPKQGISKRNIAEALYNWEKVGNLNATLNNTIFRLRRYLEVSPLPSSEYLLLNGGILRFGGETEIESDAWEFEKTAQKFRKEQDRQKKAELCEKANEIYRGEFLPYLSNEQWVIDKNCYYRELYFEEMEYLCSFLKEEGNYRKLESVSEHIVKIYPNEGWEIWRIVSLAAMNRHEEAKDLYRNVMAYIQKVGNFLSKEQWERLHEAEDMLHQPDRTEEEIRKDLMKEARGQGAYCCTFQGFSDCFHMLRRVMKRETIHFCLLLCTILDENGQPVDDCGRCEKLEERLCAVFRNRLRMGDVYTKYCGNQYLLLSVGIEKGDTSEIGARIDRDFRKRCGGRGGISCRLLANG